MKPQNAPPNWLLDYATLACKTLSFDGHKIKGRNHEARQECASLNPFHHLLPSIWMTKKVREEIQAERFFLVCHFDYLARNLLAIGFDLPTQTIISPKCWKVSRVHFLLTGELLPAELFYPQLKIARRALKRRETREQALLRISFQS